MNTVARFAYYDAPFQDIPATASYVVLKSDNPALPLHSNVSAESLCKNGVPVPMTPTYRTWLKMGSPVYRGEKVS